jgi:two-component system OmpR family sensor kinase
MRDRLIFAAWTAFAVANVVAMMIWPSWETIPFHFIWVSMALVYGFTPWRGDTTMVVLLIVVGVTGGLIIYEADHSGQNIDEVAEVPLMAVMFLAMAWHSHRRQLAIERARSLAARQEMNMQREHEFLRLASHALRTPITVARGHTELVREAHPDGQDREDIDVVLDELSRLARLSDRLLTLGAAEHPDFLQRSPVTTEWIIAEARRRWSTTAARGWVFETDVHGLIAADHIRLMDGLDALIENAVEFTHEGDVVSVMVTGDDCGAVIAVSDTGPGIPPGFLDRIFEPFVRVDAGSERRHSGGTGLGLATVKALAEAHGGNVSVRSELARGTTFELHVPWLVTVVAGEHERDPASSPPPTVQPAFAHGS